MTNIINYTQEHQDSQCPSVPETCTECGRKGIPRSQVSKPYKHFWFEIFICEVDAHWHHWILCTSTFCNRKKGNASNFVVFHAPRGFLLPVFMFLRTLRNYDSRGPLLGMKKYGATSGTLGKSINPSFSVPRIWSFDLQRAHFCKRVLNRLLLGVAWVTNLIQEHFTSYYI